MTTLFTKIIGGEIPGQLVWLDETCAAFLDIEPLTPGHVLVMPREEIDHWVDLPPDTLSHLMDVCSRIGRAQLTAFTAERVGLIVQGFEVPHAHVHVFPATSAADFDLDRKGPRGAEDLARDAEAIRAALRDQGDREQVPQA